MSTSTDRQKIQSTYPADNAFEIVPDDDVNLATVTRGIYVGGAGNLTVIMADDAAAVTFTGVVAGTVYPLRVKRVMEATTATLLIGLA